jgi:hypothetical protein
MLDTCGGCIHWQIKSDRRGACLSRDFARQVVITPGIALLFRFGLDRETAEALDIRTDRDFGCRHYAARPAEARP